MGDRQADLMEAGLVDYHYLFTTETPKEIAKILSAVKWRKAIEGKIKRFPTKKV